MTFPQNPNDGDLFEASPGLFYQYDAAQNCWIRVEGLDSIGFATPLEPGLMAPEDFQKLQSIVLPPPQASIKSEDCDFTFAEGELRLTSTDDSLTISPNVELRAGEIREVIPFQVHENTAAYDFSVNLERLIERLQSAGALIETQIQGRQGLKGEPGQDGRDELDTGPQGEDGPSGQNSVFPGSLVNDPLSIQLNADAQNRAIVDIRTEKTEEGNFLVATRANIGDPTICVNNIQPQNFTSKLLLAIDPSIREIVQPAADRLDCKACRPALYAVDIRAILEALNTRFEELVAELKESKEELYTEWLRSLVLTFNEQKAALCCALENCTTKRRNTTDRRFLETNRIQAAQADQHLVLDGDQDRRIIDTNVGRDCTLEQFDEITCISSVCTETIIDGLTNTGTTNPGQVDTFWSLGSGETLFTLVPSTYPSNYGVRSLPGARWIGPGSANATQNDAAFTDFLYTQTVNLANLSLDTLSIAGFWASDNGSEILVNGKPTGFIHPREGTGDQRSFNTVKSFNLTAGNSNFVEGENEITFRVNNINGPSALIVSFSAGLAGQNDACSMQIDLTNQTYMRLVKTLGDPNSFENVQPGDGVVLGSGLSRIEVLATNSLEGNFFKVAIIDSEFNTYVWPLQPISVSEDSFVYTFNEVDMTAIRFDGAATLRRPSFERPIIAVILEVDVQVTSASDELLFSNINLFESNGTVHQLAGFEWGGDNTALQSVWRSECSSSEAATLAGVCESCLFNVKINPTSHFSEETARIINLPAGTYSAEIVDCCAQIGIGVITGRASFQYVEDETTITQVSFPDLGVFNTNSDASSAYVGQTIDFTTAGGEVKFWIPDANSNQIDNGGSVSICLRPEICETGLDITAGDSDTAIFVYVDEILPENFIGAIRPFEGSELVEENYGLGLGSDVEGPSIAIGPDMPDPDSAQIWWYKGPEEGLFAYILFGSSSDPYVIEWDMETRSNLTNQFVIVSDDEGELERTSDSLGLSTFEGDWARGVRIAGDNLTEWTYQTYSGAAPAGFQTIAFDDSGFLTGQSPFGGRFQNGTTFQPTSQVGFDINSFWPSSSSGGPQIVVRHSFDLGTLVSSTRLLVSFTVIDKLDIYLNGSAAFIQTPGLNGGVYQGVMDITNDGGTVSYSGGNPPDNGEFTVDVPAGLLVDDTNLIVFRAVDTPGINNLLSLNIFASSSDSFGDRDGGVIGPYDDDPAAGWVFEVTPKNMGTITDLKALSSDGGEISLISKSDGIGGTYQNRSLLFTPTRNVCQIFHSQIEWLERGHRTGASCSAVIEVGGTTYIIVKRSLDVDPSCGAGESLTNQCVAQYIQAGLGHPAIAWPTIDGEEFLGLPTSGFTSFVEDETLNSEALAKIQLGDVIGPVNGDPATAIPLILWPTLT